MPTSWKLMRQDWKSVCTLGYSKNEYFNKYLVKVLSKKLAAIIAASSKLCTLSLWIKLRGVGD